MTKLIEVRGLASNRIFSFYPSLDEFELSSLVYLKDIKGLPIASSCDGEGVCKRCNFNQDKLLCQFKVNEINEPIDISYL